MRRSSWIVVAFAAGALLVTAAIGSSHRAGSTYFGTLTNHTVTAPEPSESPEPSPSPEPAEKSEPSPEPTEAPDPTEKPEPAEKSDDETGDHEGDHVHQNGPANDNESAIGAAHEHGGVGGEHKKP